METTYEEKVATKKLFNTKLEEKIYALNYLNSECKRLFDLVYPNLGVLLGKKVSLQTGGNSKIFENYINSTGIKPNYKKETDRGWLSTSVSFTTGYSLKMNVQICFNGGSYDNKTYFCYYMNEVIYLGELDDTRTILDKIKDVTFSKKTIEPKNILSKIRRYDETKEHLDKIKESIPVDLRDFLTQ